MVSYLFKALSIFTFAFFLPMGVFVGYAIYDDAEAGGQLIHG